MNLAGITAPIIFNMLHEEHPNRGRGNAGGANQENNNIIWNEAARQLYDAIMILITAWNLKPGPIYNYLKEARYYSNYAPYAYRVERINNILHRHNTSMRDIINKLSETNNNLREYQFNLLEDILHQADIISYFENADGQ